MRRPDRGAALLALLCTAQPAAALKLTEAMLPQSRAQLSAAAPTVAEPDTAVTAPASASARDDSRLDLGAELAVELRYFAFDPAHPLQDDAPLGGSVSLQPELYYEWSRDGSLTFTSFARWDSIDDERTHIDLRELLVQQRLGDFDLRVGVGRVFWGVTESVHLVDIINQTDAVENPDGEDKLGQPMLNLAWTTSAAGTFGAYVLPYFRERTLPGTESRLRAPLPYAVDTAIYESRDEERHVDLAARWSLSTSAIDLGLSHFSGTARAPRYTPVPMPAGPLLVPVYDLIEQTGLDVNGVAGGWLWKLEAIHQHNRVEDFQAIAAGFEYTLSGLRGSSWDAGLLTELLWDSRSDAAPTPFQRDVFVGTRLAANDVAGTEVLAGAVFDTTHTGIFGNIEASRRIGESGKLVIELRIFSGDAPQDPLSFFRRDDYLQLEYIRYF